MAWIISDKKLMYEGEVHYDENKVKSLIEDLRVLESKRAESLCGILMDILNLRMVKKQQIKQFSKWCDWSHTKAQSVARELFKILFYGEELDRLLDQKNRPKPNKEKADKKYQEWLKRLKKAQIEDVKDNEFNKSNFKKILSSYSESKGNLDEVLNRLSKDMENITPERQQRFLNRLIRSDHKIVRALKKKYPHCQFPGCQAIIKKKNGENYVEVAHIIPVAKQGQSTLANLIVLCPNHHKEFDFGKLEIVTNDESVLVGKLNNTDFKISKFKVRESSKSNTL